MNCNKHKRGRNLLNTCLSYPGTKPAHLGASRRVRREDEEEKSKLGSHSQNNLEIVDLLDISRDILSKVGRALTVTNNWHSFSGYTYYLASWQLHDRNKLQADKSRTLSRSVRKSIKRWKVYILWVSRHKDKKPNSMTKSDFFFPITETYFPIL